jgi:hypothetical protein
MGPITLLTSRLSLVVERVSWQIDKTIFIDVIQAVDPNADLCVVIAVVTFSVFIPSVISQQAIAQAFLTFTLFMERRIKLPPLLTLSGLTCSSKFLRAHTRWIKAPAQDDRAHRVQDRRTNSVRRWRPQDQHEAVDQ